MNTSNLRINQLADADYQWYLNYLAAIDDRDIARYAEFLALLQHALQQCPDGAR